MSNPHSAFKVSFRSLKVERLSMNDRNFPLDKDKALLAMDDLTEALLVSRTDANSDKVISSRVHKILSSVASLFRGKLELTITKDLAGGNRFDSFIDWLQNDSILVGVAKVMTNMDIPLVLDRIKNPLQQSLIERVSPDVDIRSLVAFGLVTDSRTWYLVRCNLVPTKIPGLVSSSFGTAKLGLVRYNTREWRADVKGIFEYLMWLLNH
ncbi:hypothetical protein BGX34_002016 [Mortierella sp. NVP85]|nr:hypothetical protein BGX34_002016 [Mortierella sp. NVP85]